MLFTTAFVITLPSWWPYYGQPSRLGAVPIILCMFESRFGLLLRFPHECQKMLRVFVFWPLISPTWISNIWSWFWDLTLDLWFHPTWMSNMLVARSGLFLFRVRNHLHWSGQHPHMWSLKSPFFYFCFEYWVFWDLRFCIVSNFQIPATLAPKP